MKKILVCAILFLVSSAAMANDGIVYSSSAQNIADNDACVGVAAETLLNYLASKYPDDEVDQINIASIVTKKSAATYILNASINGDGTGPTDAYTVDVRCSGTVR